MPVARLAGRQHGTVENVQGSKQRGRAVALVVVGDALDVAQSHGQHRLRALQRRKRGLKALLTGSDVDDSAQQSEADAQVVPSPGSMLAVRWLIRTMVTLPLFRVVLSPTITRPFYAVPRTSVARTAWD